MKMLRCDGTLTFEERKVAGLNFLSIVSLSPKILEERSSWNVKYPSSSKNSVRADSG